MPAMDTSADEHQAFQIRRSPSLGSGSSVIAPSGSRPGKRKLSTTAFGSSPNMGAANTPPLRSASPADLPGSASHAPHSDHSASSTLGAPSGSSPSTTADRFEDAAQDVRHCHGLGLTHSHSESGALTADRLQRIFPRPRHDDVSGVHHHRSEGAAGQYQASLEAAGPSSSGLEADPANAVASTSAHAGPSHVHELQERRCHGLGADRDYVLSNEDRRDPRSSSACVMVPLTSGQNVGVPSAEPPASGSGSKAYGSGADCSFEPEVSAAPLQAAVADASLGNVPQRSTSMLAVAETRGTDDKDDATVASRSSAGTVTLPVLAATPGPDRCMANKGFATSTDNVVSFESKACASVGPSSTPFFASSYLYSSPSPNPIPSMPKAMPSVQRHGTISESLSACPSPSLSGHRAAMKPEDGEADVEADGKRQEHNIVRQERGRMPDLLTLPPRGWTRTTSLGSPAPGPSHRPVGASDAARQMRPPMAEAKSSADRSRGSHHATETPSTPFRLQPVPESKRRRLLQGSSSRVGPRRPYDGDGRRRSEAELEHGPASSRMFVGAPQSSLRHELPTHWLQPSTSRSPVSGQANRALSVRSPAVALTPQATSISRPAVELRSGNHSSTAGRSGHRTGASRGSHLHPRDALTTSANAFGIPPVPKLPSRPALLSMKRNAILPPPVALPSHASPLPVPPLNRRRPSRLRRAHSVPNMRAKATLDVATTAQHRYVFPHHWIGYLSSQSRSSKDGTSAYAVSGRAAGLRQSGKVTPSLSQFGSTSSNTRSRTVFTPSLHPPITRHTLRELDLFEILKNPQLRHDVVFDPNVQFRPNFDGERGRRKREAGERYWAAIVREIATGCTCTAFEQGELLPCTCSAQRTSARPAGSPSETSRLVKPSSRSSGPRVSNPRVPSRIPLLVQELRAICLSILPSNFPVEGCAAVGSGGGDRPSSPTALQGDKESTDRDGNTGASDTASAASPTAATGAAASTLGPSWAATHHALISQTLDPHLISQELQHGVLDVSALISFMGSILKLHCAPMRDEAIEKMVEVVCVDGDIGKGLRLCFEILELMKLDIANHQLRSTRPYLVDTAVEFEIRWFREQVEQKKTSLDRTSIWFLASLVRARTEAPGCSRSALVSRAFNDGLLKLIFDPPHLDPLPASPSTAPVPSPSSSTLNSTFSACYPETFQFDAYRMVTFHNDVADLTIVYMLLLLYRQLACSPLDGSSSVPLSAAAIAQRQLKTVKGEIWCLLNDANLCLSSGVTSQSGSSSGKRSPSFDSKLFLGSAGGFAKLEHPRWRQAMQNVLLQIAARAHAVQVAARGPITDPTQVKPSPPSAKTQTLLNSWMDTNLCTGSPLHKLCQGRLRGIVMAMLSEKLKGTNGAITSGSNGTGASKNGRLAGIRISSPSPSSSATSRKRSSNSSDEQSDSDLATLDDCVQKRVKTDSGSSDASTKVRPDSVRDAAESRADVSKGNATKGVCRSYGPPAPVAPAATACWETTLARAGLDPFAAEIRLLCDRIAKVATFHLRVFRHLYEKTEAESHKATEREGRHETAR
ncbi:Protein SOSEKI 1 [Thecaphora frezii]